MIYELKHTRYGIKTTTAEKKLKQSKKKQVKRSKSYCKPTSDRIGQIHATEKKKDQQQENTKTATA